MKVFQTVAEIQNYLLNVNGLNKSKVGFVPTMGALHKGHLSLIEEAKKNSDISVCSIFVNPTQFNDISDFEKYPIQLDQDLEMLLKAGCDVVFIPPFEEIYPNGVLDKADVNLAFSGTTLEGAHRPGHFEGVLQVVKRLLDIVQPDVLFLGQKDYQQCLVISKLIAHYHLPVKVEICGTVREPDGLAMSSRNARLTAEERSSAVKLSKALFYIREHAANATIRDLIKQQLEWLSEDAQIRVEYLEAVDPQTLRPLNQLEPGEKAVVLIAAFVGAVRLIDNIFIS